jgi:hypothetical protein
VISDQERSLSSVALRLFCGGSRVGCSFKFALASDREFSVIELLLPERCTSLLESV